MDALHSSVARVQRLKGLLWACVRKLFQIHPSYRRLCGLANAACPCRHLNEYMFQSLQRAPEETQTFENSSDSRCKLTEGFEPFQGENITARRRTLLAGKG